MGRKKSRSRISRKGASEKSLKKSKSDSGRRSRSRLGKKAKSDSSVSSSRWSFRKKSKKNKSETTTRSESSPDLYSTTSSQSTVSTKTPSLTSKPAIPPIEPFHFTSESCPRSPSECLHPSRIPGISKDELIYMAVGFKISAIVLTMIGGAILAILINYSWMMMSNNKRSMRMAIPDQDIVYPGERYASEPIEYSSFVNGDLIDTKIKACLDDNQTHQGLRDMLAVKPCIADTFYVPQYFHYSQKSKTFSKLNINGDPSHRLCLEANYLDDDPLKEILIYLDHCATEKKEQNWIYFPNWHIFNPYFNSCITRHEPGGAAGPAILKPCEDGVEFIWTSMKAKKKPGGI